MVCDVMAKVRTRVLLAPLLFIANYASAWAASDRVFTVGSYPVEASANSAVAAKDKALADGQQAAFRSLLKRIVPVTAYKQLSRVYGTKADSLVSGVSVQSERNSATDYIASLDFSFQADAVRSLLSRESIPFVDEQADDVTLVPVLRQGNPPVSANDTSSWRKAWQGLDLKNTLTPVTLGELKSVIHNDTVEMLSAGDFGAMRILAQEYTTPRVVFAILDPDPSNKKMIVTLAGEDAVGPFLLKRTYRISDGDVAYASELAAVVALGIFEGRWKAIKSQGSLAANQGFGSERPVWAAAGGTASGEAVRVIVEFNSQSQWNEMRAQLLDTPGVEDLEITTATDFNSEVSLRYPGGAQGLARAVGGRGLTLANIGETWVLRSNY